MEEKRAREIVENYLRKADVVFSPKKATEAGPDILIEGKAIEVKGSDLQEKDALKQLARYVTEYAALTFAFPLEKLSFSLLYGLLCLEEAVKHVRLDKGQVKIMLLLDIDGRCFLRPFESVDALVKEVGEVLQDERLSYRATPEEIRDKLGRLLENIEDTIRRLLRQRILNYSTLYSVSQ